MGMESLSEAEQERVALLTDELSRREPLPAGGVCVVRSPYRACPLGAHVDHQLGAVTGMALDRALLLAFAPRSDRRVALSSHQFEGVVEFDLDGLPSAAAGDWADYARGAAHALRTAGEPLRRGLTGIVSGHDDAGGLSSSAAAGVAYLLALEAANGLDVAPERNIELDRVIENDFIGLDNGILDQSCILLGRRRHLLSLDCKAGRHRAVPLGSDVDFSVAVLFSGLRIPLTGTDYNRRVDECRQAAAALLRAAGQPVPERPVLRDVPADVFDDHHGQLPGPLRRRARHFFTEQERVRRGVEAWRRGDLVQFGRLMSASGRSSVEDYECGNRYLRSAYEILCDCPGVYGARFSGAGFRGCCVALVRPECEEEIARLALERYVEVHPDVVGRAKVYFCRSGDGAALLT